MTILLDEPDRVFQVWAYTVGMGRLVLRSTKNASFRTRIDVLFQDVQVINLPAVLNGLTISTMNADEAEVVTRSTGILRDEDFKFFALTGSDFAGYVVAGTLASCEDSGEYYDPSELWPISLGQFS